MFFPLCFSGNRIQKSVDADGDGPGAAAVTKFAYGGADAWADMDNAGNLTMRRLYRDAVDQVFARIGSGGAVDWYFTDRLGSVRDIWNPSGGVLDHLDYDAFGKITAETNPANGDRYVFTGRERDTEIGLYYYRARYYSFEIGRFISEDPIKFATGDPNLYRYVGNQPTGFTDPSGLATLEQIRAGYRDAVALQIRYGRETGHHISAQQEQAMFQQVENANFAVGGGLTWYQSAYYNTVNEFSVTGGFVWNNPGAAADAFGEGLTEGAEFMRGVADGIASGAWGFVTGLADMLAHPIDTLMGAYQFAQTLISMAADGDVQAILAEFFSELLTLINEWPTATPYRRGFLIGQMIGQYAAGAAGGAAFAHIMGRIWQRLRARGCNNSFVPGTLVLMADGTTKPIDEVKLGDWVWAEDHETGERGAREVLTLIVGQGEKHLIDVEVEGHIVTATHDHPFWVESRHEWVFAENLQTGDDLLTDDGDHVAVEDLDHRVVPFETVYNLTVADLHTYFVVAGDQPVLVHNCPGDGPNANGPHANNHGDPEAIAGLEQFPPPAGGGAGGVPVVNTPGGGTSLMPAPWHGPPDPNAVDLGAPVVPGALTATPSQ